MKIFLFFFLESYKNCRVGTKKNNRVGRVSRNTGIFFRPESFVFECLKFELSPSKKRGYHKYRGKYILYMGTFVPRFKHEYFIKFQGKTMKMSKTTQSGLCDQYFQSNYSIIYEVMTNDKYQDSSAMISPWGTCLIVSWEVWTSLMSPDKVKLTGYCCWYVVTYIKI